MVQFFHPSLLTHRLQKFIHRFDPVLFDEWPLGGWTFLLALGFGQRVLAVQIVEDRAGNAELVAGHPGSGRCGDDRDSGACTLCRCGDGAAGLKEGDRLGHAGIASILRSHNSTLTSCQKNIMWLSTRC